MNIEDQRREVKEALVEAHRTGDWESARLLSQQKQKLRKRDCTPRPCEVCGNAATGRRCHIHRRDLYSMRGYNGPKLNAPKLCGATVPMLNADILAGLTLSKTKPFRRAQTRATLEP